MDKETLDLASKLFGDIFAINGENISNKDKAEMFQQRISEIYQARLDRDYSSKPPWQLRKTRDTAYALANPDISRDVMILHICSKRSIFKYQHLLLEYFQHNYGLSLEPISKINVTI